ncbi:MAG TPA: HD domain-containing phosphohydrolase [Vicinamibacteria bacterium]|nr:HD domain-containing phosphohydrolase [Vicinamibacteria bacterium]
MTSPRDPSEYIGKLTAVLTITKAYRSIIHLDVLLKTIVETAAETLRAEAGSILLYDEDGNLRFRTASGRAAAAVEPMRVEPGRGVAGWTAISGKPAIVNDVRDDPRFHDGYDRETGFETHSILCVPLTFEGRVIGVLEVLNKRDGAAFDEEDQSILFSLADQAAISIEHVRLQDAQNNYFSHVSEILLGAMDTHVPIKWGHARRVARYARVVGAGMGMDAPTQKTLYFGGLLHDIGLLKLDATEEWTRERIELHPLLGYEMVKDIIFWKDLAPIILHHHERWDGRGYPERLAGENIPLGARIIGACEAFDVITSKHSYKSPLPHDMAIREMEAHEGAQFDPDVVAAIKATVREEDNQEKPTVSS